MRQAEGQVAQLLVRHGLATRAVLGDLAGAVGWITQPFAFLTHLARAGPHVIGALAHVDLRLSPRLGRLGERMVAGARGVGSGAFSLRPGLGGALKRLGAGQFTLTASLLSRAAGVLAVAARFGRVASGLGGMYAGLGGLGASRLDLTTFLGRQVLPGTVDDVLA